MKLKKNNKKKFVIKPGYINKIYSGNKKKIILTTGKVQELAKKINDKNYSIFSLPIWGKKTKNTTLRQLSKFSEIVTVEDHLEDGGFGSWINECLNKSKNKINVINKFISDKVVSKVGSKNYLMKKYGP
tara:strand:- start:269 stop:655 length:387 start_codon:yes stop_codon:yes gene_type:complete